MVAGEHTETARIDRHGIVKGELGDVEQIAWTAADDNTDQVDVTVDLTAAGDAVVRLVQSPRRNQAVALRNALGNEPGKRREKLERRLATSFGKVVVQSVRCSDLLDMAQPVRLEVEFEAVRFAARSSFTTARLPTSSSSTRAASDRRFTGLR